ncbi:MAG: 2TM domain-containing protein [Coriobacteriia bacterium]|nr:2TM domain-containing protein [Coriobacteriia bacterium]
MSSEEELRKQALHRIGERRSFYMSLAVYVVVNAVLVGVWFINGRGYFWPGWPIFGWGIGVAIQGFRALVNPDGPSEADVQREMDKMRGKS